jgi:hypothetical protein
MAWLPVNIAMILGHQDLTLGRRKRPLQWRNIAIALTTSFELRMGLRPTY